MPFDLDGAVKAGYSAMEVADYLASKKGFDVEAARGEGYKDEEIIKHLQPQARTLFSGEGIKSVGDSIGPGLAAGTMGEQLRAHEAVKQGYKKYGPGPMRSEEHYNEAVRRIPELQKALQLMQQDASVDSTGAEVTDSTPLRWVKGAAQSIAQNAPTAAGILLSRTPSGTIAGGVTSAMPGLYGAYQQQAGQTYGEARTPNEQGKTPGTIEQARVNADVSALAEVSFEMLPVKFAVENLGKLGFWNFVKGYFGKELATELPTTVAQDVSTWATTHQDMPVGDFLKKLGQDLIDTAAVTVLSSAATGSGMHGVRKLGQMEENLKAGKPMLGEPAAVVGDNNQPLTDPLQSVPVPPTFDVPTTELPDSLHAALDAQLNAMDPALITEESVAEARKVVAEHQTNSKHPVIPEAAAAWNVLNTPSEIDAGEIGDSIKTSRNARNYLNENDAIAPLEQTFTDGPSVAIGLTPQQHLPEKSTYVLGFSTADRSGEYMTAARDTLEPYRLKYMPDETIVLVNRTLPLDNASGWHTVENGVHVIIPAPLRNMKDPATFNANRLGSSFFTLFHEFGHALMTSQFWKGVDPLTIQTARMEGNNGLLSEQTLAALPEAQAALAREFNEKKARIADQTMTAEEFVTSWMGPAKSGRKNIFESARASGTALALVAKIADRSIVSINKDRVENGQPPLTPEVAGKIKAGLMRDYLSFDEYFAEQTARHAYKAQWDLKTPLEKFLGGIVAKLRQLFIDQKKDHLIAPGTAFSAWMEGLTKEGKLNPSPELQVAKKKAKGPKKVAAEGEVKAPKKAGKKKVVKTQSNAETSTEEEKYKQGTALISDLISNGQLEMMSPDAKKLLELLKTGDYAEFVDLYKKYSGKETHFELKPPGGMWDPNQITDLADQLTLSMISLDSMRSVPVGEIPEEQRKIFEWASSRIKNYLNKYAGTAVDPLYPLQVPFEGGLRAWGDLWRQVTSSIPAWLTDQSTNMVDYPKGAADWLQKVPRDEPVYSLRFSTLQTISPYTSPASSYLPSGIEGNNQVHDHTTAEAAIISYLHHVGDFLVQSNLSVEQLQKYDLVRAFRETHQNDQRARLEAAKNLEEKLKAAREITAALPASAIYKTYPDGTVWIKLDNTLDHEQLLLNLAVDTETCPHCIGAVGHHEGGYEAYVPVRNIVTRKKAIASKPDTNQYIDKVVAGTHVYYSLRSKDGKTQGTVEVRQSFNAVSAISSGMTEEAFIAAQKQTGGLKETDNFPAILQFQGPSDGPLRDEFHLQGQDFVKSGQWGSVANLDHIDLYRGPNNTYLNRDEAIAVVKPYLELHPDIMQGGQRVPSILQQLEEPGKWSSTRSLLESLLDRVDRNTNPERRGNFSLDADLDDLPENTKFLKGIRNFLSDPAPLRRSLRILQGQAFWALQIQQLAHLNPQISGLQSFVSWITSFNVRKSALQAVPDQLAARWSKLSSENFERVNKVFLDEFEGGRHWFDLVQTPQGHEFKVNADALAELQKRGVDLTTPEGEELGKLILDVKNDLLKGMDRMEATLRYVSRLRLENASEKVLIADAMPITLAFNKLRSKPWIPQGRFGNHLLLIEKKKESGGWELVHREAFESEAEAQKAHKKAWANRKADEQVTYKHVTDQSYVLMGIPNDFLDLAASELALEDEQVQTLAGLLQPINMEKQLKSYDLARLGISGYSKDVLRSYANFSWHNANLIAKLEYRSKLNLAIRAVDADLRKAQVAGPQAEPDVWKLTKTSQAMRRTRDYMMAPPNEAQMLRAAVSIMYLGLNVKTALINFYGLVTTWSDMTERMGLLNGSKIMAIATKQMFQSVKLTNLNERRAGNYLTPELQAALDRAIKEGVLSQSYAYHLAGMANSSNLFRMPARQTAARVGRNMIDAAMFPFRLTELGTRRVSFLAEYTAAKLEEKAREAQGGTLDLNTFDAYETAIQRVNKLQNDYSTGNRVPFMRGVSVSGTHPLKWAIEPAIPLATIFMSFAQHMAFHGYGGYELGERRKAALSGETPRQRFGTYTMKIWIITLLLAGYEGLPGAENLLDLLEAAWRKWGGAKPVRQELREFIQSIEMLDLDPQAAAHGLGHNFSMFGMIPPVDVSRSLGFGRIVPGTDVLAHPGQNANELMGALVLSMMGPAGNLIKFGLSAAFSDKPPAEALKHLPGGLGNLYAAYEWSQFGVRSATGAQLIIDPETGKPRDMTTGEIWEKALGFNPTVVSEAREKRFQQHDRQIYWQTRRKGLLDSLDKATWQKSETGKADAKKAIQEFNAGIPDEFRAIRITGIDIARSLQAKRKNRQQEERGQPNQRRYRGLYEDVSQSYE